MRALTRVEARKHRKRGDYMAAAVALVTALILGMTVTAFVVLRSDLDAANKARDALARQVEGLGEKPVAGPPGSRGKTGEAVVGRTGLPGPQGAPGSPGPKGASGKAAPTITPSPGPSGPSGPSGPAGQVGADSTVPGPSGPPGQDATGAPGTNGRDGADGKDGSPPAEWTYTDTSGVTYRCSPVDGFDPRNPRYRCTPTSTPNPTPTSDSSTAAVFRGPR
ncbi:collagen-like protein [Streptomyces sp. NBC_01240]|uniref:collagen-like protein n=1 Tax=Streptomyces sp. NBC_01240 TaxID=2903793 RepID=UPI002E0DA16E|nr:collagen-like protein [Streptomyces sp. NBC_01240]